MVARAIGIGLLLTAALSGACSAGAPGDGVAGESGSAPPASAPAFAAAAASHPAAMPTHAIPATVLCEWDRVLAVDDGDTFRVQTGAGTEDRVRLIGVDAPEGGKPLAAEATSALAALLAETACLEADTTDRDRFGRLLRYAWTAAGTLVNEAMVAHGLANVATYPPDTRYLTSRYEPAEQQARAAGLGLWALATSAAAPASATGAATAGPPTPAAGGTCEPSYPDVCIPPVSVVGDLDCGDIPHRRFRVLPPDPHRFDSDRDGIGCEGG